MGVPASITTDMTEAERKKLNGNLTGVAQDGVVSHCMYALGRLDGQGRFLEVIGAPKTH